MIECEIPRHADMFEKLLHFAELDCGPRDPEYQITQIVYGPRPSVFTDHDEKTLKICLSERSATDDGRALEELAHEVIHVLTPTDYHLVTYLEEGLAVFNSRQVFFSNHPLNGFSNERPFAFGRADSKYIRAYETYSRFSLIYPGFIRAIRKANQGLKISQISAPYVHEFFPGSDFDIVERLTAKFNP